jgi:hypothetical protein
VARTCFQAPSNSTRPSSIFFSVLSTSSCNFRAADILHRPRWRRLRLREAQLRTLRDHTHAQAARCEPRTRSPCATSRRRAGPHGENAARRAGAHLPRRAARTRARAAASAMAIDQGRSIHLGGIQPHWSEEWLSSIFGRFRAWLRPRPRRAEPASRARAPPPWWSGRVSVSGPVGRVLGLLARTCGRCAQRRPPPRHRVPLALDPALSQRDLRASSSCATA